MKKFYSSFSAPLCAAFLTFKSVGKLFVTIVFLTLLPFSNTIKAQPSFLFPDVVSVQPGEAICLPVTIQDFTDLLIVQFSVNWDPTVLTFESVNQLHPAVSPTHFVLDFIEHGKIAFNWSVGLPCTASSGAATLLDHSVLFELCFQVVGEIGSTTPIAFTDDPLEQYVTRMNANCNDIGSFSTDGFVAVCPSGVCPEIYGSEEEIHPDSEFYFDIRAKKFEEIVDLRFSLSWDTAVVTFEGLSSLLLPNLEPTHFDLTSVESGILTLDYSVDNPTIGVTLDTDELLFKLRFKAVGESSMTTPFRFVALPVAKEMTTVADPDTGHGIFVNGKMKIKNPLGNNYSIRASDEWGLPGDIECIDITISELDNLNVLALNLEWDPTVVMLSEIEDYNTKLLSFGFMNMDTTQAAEGLLAVDWTSGSPIFGPDLFEDELLFRPCFELVGALGDYSLVGFSEVEITTWQSGNSSDYLAGSISMDCLQLYASEKAAAPGDTILVDVSATDFKAMRSMQFSMNWDAVMLGFEGIQNLNLQDLTTNDFGTTNTDNGTLTFDWTENTTNGITITDETILFQVAFKVNALTNAQTAITFDDFTFDNGSVNNCSALNDGQVEIDASDCFTLIASDQTGQQGNIIEAEISVKNFNEILSMEYSINWDSEELEFLDVQTLGLPMFDVSNNLSLNVSDGTISVSWLDPSGTGITLDDATPIIRISFTIIGDINSDTQIYFSNDPLGVEIFSNAAPNVGNPICYNLEPGITQIIDCDSIPDLIHALTSDTILCGINPVELWVDAPDAVSITWANDMGVLCTDCPNPIEDTPLYSNNYLVQVIDANGCNEVREIFVDVRFGLDWGLQPWTNAPICEGETLEFFANDPFIVDYIWLGPNGFVANSNPVIIPNADPSMTGVYTVDMTDDAGCNVNESFLVMVEAAPSADAGIDQMLNCLTSTTTLDGSGSSQGANFTYQWVGAPNIINSHTLSPTVTEPGIYTLIVSSIQNGCSAMDEVEVFDGPIADAGSDTTFNCGNLALQLDGTGSSQGIEYEYFWEPLNIGGVLGLVFPGQENSLTPQVSGGSCYQLTVTNTDTSCEAFDTVCIDSPIIPNINMPLDSLAACADTLVLNAAMGSSGGANIFYQWTASNGGEIIEPTDTMLLPTIIGSGTYIFTITHAGSNCSASDSILVSLDGTSPLAKISAMELDCDGIFLDGFNSGTAPNIQYSWTGPCILSDSLQPVIEIDTCTGTYFLTVTDLGTGCSSVDSITVTNLFDLEPPVADAGEIEVTCTNNFPLQLDGSNSSTGVAYEYLWTTPDGLILSDAMTLSPSVDLLGTYILTVIDVNTGCISVDTALFINNTAIPFADAGPDQVLDCNTSSVVLDGSNSTQGPNILYEWHDDNGNMISNDILITVSVSGIYTLIVRDVNNGCIDAEVVIVTEDFSVPNVNIPGDHICLGDSVIIDLNGFNFSNATWTPSTNASCASCLEVILYPEMTTTYNVVATSSNNGCTGSDNFTIIVDQLCTYPGDIDTTGFVNNHDLLFIGLGFDSVGFARPNASLEWKAQLGQPWTQSTPKTHTNYKHLDSDGNGIINADDTLALSINWGSWHNLTDDQIEDQLIGPPVSDGGDGVPFYVSPDTIYPSMDYALPVLLGTFAEPAPNVYGVAFSITYDPDIVKPGTAKIDFSNSWVGTLFDDMLAIQRDFHEEGRIDIALVRTDGQNVTGFGEISTMFITIEDIIFFKNGDDSAESVISETLFEIQNVKIISFQEEILEVNTEPYLAPVVGVGGADLEQNIQIFPNPAEDIIHVLAKDVKLENLEVWTLTGQLIRSIVLSESSYLWKVAHLERGTYLLKIQTEEGIIVKRVLLF